MSIMEFRVLLSSVQIRVLGIFGALSPIIYLIATIIGGFLWAGYSHYSETVSTLTSSGAPNQTILAPLFACYNLFVVILAIGLYFGVKGNKPRFGSIFLALAGAAGLILFWFPQDYPQGSPTTFTGTMHIAIAGIIAFASLASMLSYALTLRKVPNWNRIARFCFLWLAIAIILGGFGAISITTSYAGLAERLSISSILLWIEIMSITLINKTKP
jgi:hypothetical protein